MPNNKKKRQNPKKKNQRSAAASTCVQCAKQISKKHSNTIECVCTRVLFCSHDCQVRAEQLNTHACPGPPKNEPVNIREKLEEFRSTHPQQGCLSSESKESREEFRRTISYPLQDVLLRHGLKKGLDGDLLPEEYAEYADEGNPACAYMAGVKYKHRFLGKQGCDGDIHTVQPREGETPGVLQTNDLAFKYFSQAAEAGIGLAMQSLAECYEKGIGVRENMMFCRDWLWHAALIGSSGAMEMLDSKIIVARELVATSDMQDAIEYQMVPGQTTSPSGPHLGSLLYVLYHKAKTKKFLLPAFAAPTPTLSLGNGPCQGTTGDVPLVASQELRQVLQKTVQMERHRKFTVPVYGRRGVGKAATAQTYCEANRSLDNPLYVVPPAPKCYEVPTPNEFVRAKDAFKGTGLEVHCIHEDEKGARIICAECMKEATERLGAISRGCLAISVDETLPARGREVIWRSVDGSLKSETFKNYGRAEVETTLAALVAYLPNLAHPLFIAQDPNFIWPLIQHHGCVRAALEYVAPYIDWEEKLGRIREATTPEPIIKSLSKDKCIESGTILRRCGNDLCCQLQLFSKTAGNFFECGGCGRRIYCSNGCMKTDWIFHKRECRAATSGAVPKASPQFPITRNETRRRHTASLPQKGEDVVIFGLVAKPEFNGRVGQISGNQTEDRYPVKIPGVTGIERIILVKPSNFHRLGITSKQKQGKPRKFECTLHGNDVCTECCLDFSIANNLSKIQHTGTEDGVSLHAIEKVVNMHYASIEHPDFDTDSEGMYKDYSMECQGLSDPQKKLLLDTILKDEMKLSTLHVEAAIVGMTCFSGRSLSVVRPYTLPHLANLMKKL